MVVTALLFVRVYGQLEFGSWMLKIMLIIGINNMLLVIACGGGANHKTTGFEYWTAPYGPFVQYLNIHGSLGRFLGFWTTLSNALYAYLGIDNITVAAAETRCPRQA